MCIPIRYHKESCGMPKRGELNDQNIQPLPKHSQYY